MLCRGMCTWSRMQRITECTGVWHTCASSPLPLLSAAASRSRCADLVTVLSSLHAQASSPPKWCSIGGREALRCLCFPAGLLLTGGRQLHDGVHCQTIYTRRLHLCCRRQRQQTCRSCKRGTHRTTEFRATGAFGYRSAARAHQAAARTCSPFSECLAAAATAHLAKILLDPRLFQGR